MKIRGLKLIAIALLALSTGASAQTVSGVTNTARSVGAPTGGAPATSSIEGEAMPADRIEAPTTLDRELEAIRAALPSFNSVVVRDADVAVDYPTLPAMTLKNVTVGQFLQFVQASYPGVECRRIDGPAGSLFSFRIRQDDQAVHRALAAQERNRVRLYRLTDVINSLADESAAKDKSRDERIKDATNQVLSLLQAALDQTEGDAPSTLKIHEPTLTLMFKGSQTKQLVLEDALSTLHPSSRGGTKRALFGAAQPQSPWQLGNNTNGYDPGAGPADAGFPSPYATWGGFAQPKESGDEISRIRAELAARTKEIDALKAQLNQYRKATGATTKQSKD